MMRTAERISRFRARAAQLPVVAFGRPGPEREDVTRHILDGARMATTTPLADYLRDGEPLPVPGTRYQLVDSTDEPVAIVELAAVTTCRVDDVDLAPARPAVAGGTDDAAARWQAAHRAAWPGIDGDTEIVVAEFEVVELPSRHRAGSPAVTSPAMSSASEAPARSRAAS
ncbi:ASCH domain-containing protein [Cryocola sp. 340MFSha3.1]|uniref:ASCH domain-containing protein n=1 Tax=Cryocola sp. 340MFSha3.1 TaxID=1169145 RepID=UPI001E572CE1|nr:ASCH domain-containing protein [Cryocola sp. 340MFSha3.1]